MSIKSELLNILENHNGGAFLFIGSGFSRRYLGLEDWAGLLSKFTEDVKDFEFYKSWGTINKKIESYYPYHGSSYLFHNTSSKDVQDFSKRSIRPTFLR